MVDATGMHALIEVCEGYKSHGSTVILSGVSPYVRELLLKAGVDRIIGEENIVDHIDKALALAEKYLSGTNV